MIRVLIVDDDPELRRLICLFYEKEGRVECVGAESLESLSRIYESEGPFSLAILDINLGASKFDGVDVYHWLKERNFPGRVVFLTGHASSDPRVRRALEIDGTVLLEKPAGISALKEIFESLETSAQSANEHP
jgi:DNA-binding response OmpR family regulator